MFEPTTTTPGLDALQRGLRVGDGAVVTREVLAEVGREAAGLPPTWIDVPAGTRGTVIGWREPDGNDGKGDHDGPGTRVILEVYGGDQRVVVFIGIGAIERALPTVQIARPSVQRRSRRH